jgi:hypothetical protein
MNCLKDLNNIEYPCDWTSNDNKCIFFLKEWNNCRVLSQCLPSLICSDKLEKKQFAFMYGNKMLLRTYGNKSLLRIDIKLKTNRYVDTDILRSI